jgi:hypothetical protein
LPPTSQFSPFAHATGAVDGLQVLSVPLQNPLDESMFPLQVVAPQAVDEGAGAQAPSLQKFPHVPPVHRARGSTALSTGEQVPTSPGRLQA